MIKSQEWFENKVKDYHGDKVEILSKYNGSEKPIDFVYHCNEHGDTYGTVNAKNICKSYYLPCKKCQSIRKSNASQRNKKDKNFYYNRLVAYCKEHDGYVLEKKWTRAKDQYHFKCDNPEHPIFETTADALYSGEHWCPYCSGRAGNFEEEISNILKSKDGRLLSEYNGSYEYVTVQCNKHNYIWSMLPSNIKKESILRDKQKDTYCVENSIPLYRMEVPFRNNKKWDYQDYYRYINTELKEIVNITRKNNGGI